MRMDLTKWVVYFAMAAFAVLSLCAKNAVGQSGVRCVNTQTITIYCQTCDKSGCSCIGHTTIVECSGGYGDGTLYQTKTVGCCTSNPSTLQRAIRKNLTTTIRKRRIQSVTG